MLISLRPTSSAARRRAGFSSFLLLGALALAQATAAAAFFPGGATEPQRADATLPEDAYFPQRTDSRAARLPEAPKRIVLGIHYAEVGAPLAAQVGRPKESLTLVTNVMEGSPAQGAGLRKYDVIAKIDGGSANLPALTAAGRDLAAGKSVELEVFRRGQPTVFVIGPIDDAFKQRWRETLQGLGRRDRVQDVTENVARAKKQDVQRERGQRDQLEHAAKLLELARGYYRDVDSETFRSDLHEGLKVLKELNQRGQLNDVSKEYGKQLNELLQRKDMDSYIHRARSAFETMSARDFWEQAGKRLESLDPEAREMILRRWREGNRQLPRADSDSDRRFDDAQRSLDRARDELHKQEQELEDLRRRVRELEQRQGGR